MNNESRKDPLVQKSILGHLEKCLWEAFSLTPTPELIPYQLRDIF